MITADSIDIKEFDNLEHREQVAALWRDIFGYDTPHNSPELVIDRKCAVYDGLFFVAVSYQVVVGTVMAGYDGHRGWIYSLAVHPAHRMRGIGSALLAFAERKLLSLGCVKINLQIKEENEDVRRFYQANGYVAERRVSMGKRLEENFKGD